MCELLEIRKAVLTITRRTSLPSILTTMKSSIMRFAILLVLVCALLSPASAGWFGSSTGEKGSDLSKNAAKTWSSAKTAGKEQADKAVAAAKDVKAKASEKAATAAKDASAKAKKRGAKVAKESKGLLGDMKTRIGNMFDRVD